MHRILYVPLDERACNYKYPAELAALTEDMELLRPDRSLMGHCKEPADCEKIWDWLFEKAPQCEYAVLSVDTLVYGNIINSRIHHKSQEECRRILDRFEELKRINPNLRIHAFNLAARVAAYNNSAEDPDYWASYGYAIWRYTFLTDKQNRGHSSEKEDAELISLKSEIPDVYLDDFLARRRVDRATNLRCVELTEKGVFDVLTVPKDDTAEYGYAAMDQKAIAEKVREKRLMDRVLVYPGADEVGCVIFARVFNLINNYIPRVYPRFSSVLGPGIVPRYEDRPIFESLKSQIYSAGGVCVDSPLESDMMIALNTPGKVQIESMDQYNKDLSFSSHINMHEFLRYINYYCDTYKKAVGIAEVSVANGCENEFMDYALISGTLHKIQALGGWNTCENTVGLVLAQTVIASYYDCFRSSPKKSKTMEEIKLHSIIADWLFQSNVLHRFLYETKDSINPYEPGEKLNFCLNYIERELRKIILEKFGPDYKGWEIKIQNPCFDWPKVFFFAFDVRLENKEQP